MGSSPLVGTLPCAIPPKGIAIASCNFMLVRLLFYLVSLFILSSVG